MFELLEQKEVTIDGRQFILSKFPAVAGREIVAKYGLSSIPKLGDYSVNQETMLKLMSYVAVPHNGGMLRLNTIALIDNHAGGWETLMKVEGAMMEYNCSFFQNGRLSTFLNDTAQKIPAWILKILTALSEQLSRTEKPHSTN